MRCPSELAKVDTALMHGALPSCDVVVKRRAAWNVFEASTKRFEVVSLVCLARNLCRQLISWLVVLVHLHRTLSSLVHTAKD